MDPSSNDPIVNLIQTYHELNPHVVDELHTEPDPLTFLRYVWKNRPFIVREGVSSFTAVKKWDSQYLRQVMKDKKVNVAVTPKG